MTGPRVEPEVERRARIQRETQIVQAAIREGRLPPEAMQRYIERERITPEQEAANTPLTGLEKVAGGVSAFNQGTTFGLGDEIVGALSPWSTIDEERRRLGQFREQHPAAALGLELGGGIVSGLGAGAVAGGSAVLGRSVGGAASTLGTAGRVAAAGAGGGALAGYGSGEGGPVSGDRLGRAAGYGALGGIVGAAAPKVLQSSTGLAGLPGTGADEVLEAVASKGPTMLDILLGSAAKAAPGAPGSVVPNVSRGTPRPVMPWGPEGVSEASQRAAQRAIGDTEQARTLLDMIERGGMGDEALAMNTGTDRTVRAVRAAANMPNSNAGQIVNERLARQGGALGEQVPRDIGTVTGIGSDFPEVTARNMQRDLSAKVEEGYAAFRALPEVPLDPTDEAQRLFIERYVNPVIQNRRLSGNLTNASALSGENIDAAFKNLQREVRGGNAGVSMGSKGIAEVQGLEAMRDRVLAAIGQTDPNYANLARTYALDADVGKVVQESFETGRGIKTPGQATVAREAAERVPGSERALRAGNVATLQSAARRGASNADLGDLALFRDVARAVVGTPESRETFIALHGQEQYDALLERLMPKIRAAAQNAAARGNSTTAKQLMDALAFGDDAALDALGQLTSGNKRGAVMSGLSWLGQKTNISPTRAWRMGVGKTADETANLLTTKGAPQIRTLLDLLDQIGQSDAAREAAAAPVRAVSGRVAPTAEQRRRP